MAAPAPVLAPAPLLESALQELQRQGGQRAALLEEQTRAEAEAARGAAEIEELKGQAPGVTRDLQLQARLAQAEARAVALSRRASALRVLEGAVAATRQRVIRACDQLLAGAPGTAQRLELLRLRAAQVDALTAAPRAAQVLSLAARSGAGTEDDDPQVLRERADLLRDSADKLRRELSRLEERSQELLRRRRLQERAAAVDDDLFAEQAVSRRTSARSDKAGASFDAAATAPGSMGPRSPETAPAPGGSPVLSQATAGSLFVRGVDPSTLDLLRGGAADPADPEARLKALLRAQGELRRILDQLNQRAAVLEQRGAALQRQK